MYRGEYSREAVLNNRRRDRRRKRSALVVSVVLAGLLLVGGTVAFLTATTGSIVNTFSPATPSIAVEEDLENNVKSNVTVKNTGDVPVYVRAKILVSWQDDGGNVFTPAPMLNADYTLNQGSALASGSAWVEADDGFWYYTIPVSQDTSTTNLIDSCAVTASANVPVGCHLSVEVISSAIQSSPARAVQEAWGVTISEGSVEPYAAVAGN